MARTVKVSDFQRMQAGEISVGEFAKAELSNRPGFQAPALSVAEQLQALVLSDDIAGMPLGQVVGLVRMAVAEKHVNATESEIRDEAERRMTALQVDDAPVEPKPEDRAECSHAVLGLHGICTACGDFVGEDRAESESLDSATEAASPSETEATATGMIESWEREAIQREANCTAEMSLSMITDRVREAARLRGIQDELTDAEVVSMAEAIWDAYSINRKGPRVADVNPDGTVADWRRPDMTPDRGEGVGETHHTISDDDETRFSGAGASDGQTQQASMFLVPADKDFGAEEYRNATELATLAGDLIEERGYLQHLGHCKIGYLWKRKTGVSKGRRITGVLERQSGTKPFFSRQEFLVILAADTARERKHTARHVARSLLRCLRRIGQDDKGNWIELPFTLQLDVEDIQEFADLDDEDLKLARKAHRMGEQMGLFAEDVDGDEDLEDARWQAARAGYVEDPTNGAGVLIHADGTPLTADEIAEQEAAELRDDASGLDCVECGQMVNLERGGNLCDDCQARPLRDELRDDPAEDILADDPSVL